MQKLDSIQKDFDKLKATFKPWIDDFIASEEVLRLTDNQQEQVKKISIICTAGATSKPETKDQPERSLPLR